MRGAASALGFDDVLLTGLARDGGLFLPETWPSLDLNSLMGLDYPDLARGSRSLLGGRIKEAEFAGLVRKATRSAISGGAPEAGRRPDLAPGAVPWADPGLQGCGPAAPGPALRPSPGGAGPAGDHRRRPPATPARPPSRPAGTDFIDIFILHPRPPRQRRQMTAAPAPTCAISRSRAPSDDCRGKGHVRRRSFRTSMRLGAVNSINGAGSLPRSSITWPRPWPWYFPPAPGRLRRADGQFRQDLCRLCRPGHGAAHREADRRFQQQRHPVPLHRLGGAPWKSARCIPH